MLVTTISAAMMARGMVFCGFLTSSPAVDTASSPMKVKKIVLAAAVIPAKPACQKSAKWSVVNAVNAMRTNIASTQSLMITMTVLTVADSLAPRISNSAHMTISTMAGRLTMPGLSLPHGAAISACGSCQPNRLSRSLFR